MRFSIVFSAQGEQVQVTLPLYAGVRMCWFMSGQKMAYRFGLVDQCEGAR